MRLTKFVGMFPKANPFARDPSVADVAINLDPTRGTLRSFRDRVNRSSIGRDRRFDVLGCDIVELPAGTEFSTVYSPSSKEIVTVNDGVAHIGEVIQGELMNLRPLCVTPPGTPPTVIAQNSMDDKARWRVYAYTFCSPLGEESAPSPASPQALIVNGDAVTLSFSQAPPIGYTIRIYRSATATRNPDEALGLKTAMLLVAEVPGTTKMYEDKVEDGQLGRGLDTAGEGVLPPTVSIICKVGEAIPVMAAAFGHQLMFSKPHRPNAWDYREELSLRGNITAMTAAGGKLMVVTQVGSYLIDAVASNGVRGVVHLLTAPPPLSMSKDAIVATPMGAVYLSVDGLTVITPTGEVVNITANAATAHDIRRMFHGTVALGYRDNVVYVSTETSAWAVPMGAGGNALVAQGIIEVPRAVARQYKNTNTGELYGAHEDEVFQWDAGEYLKAVWETTLYEYFGALTSCRGLMLPGSVGEIFIKALPSGDTSSTQLTGSAKRLRPVQRSSKITVRLEVVGELVAVGLAATARELAK